MRFRNFEKYLKRRNLLFEITHPWSAKSGGGGPPTLHWLRKARQELLLLLPCRDVVDVGIVLYQKSGLTKREMIEMRAKKAKQTQT